MAKWIAAAKARAGLRRAVIYPNVTGKTKERIAQSKRTRAVLIAIVDYPQVAQTCIPRAFGLQMSCRLSLVSCLFRLFFVFILSFNEAAALHSIILRYAGAPTATPLYFIFPLVSLQMLLFPSIFCAIAVFSLYGEYVVRFLFPGSVFLPCDHVLDFFTSACMSIQSIINQSNKQYIEV